MRSSFAKTCEDLEDLNVYAWGPHLQGPQGPQEPQEPECLCIRSSFARTSVHDSKLL